MKKILIIADGVTTAHPTRMEVLAMQLDKTRFEIHFATSAKYFPILSLSKYDIPVYPITSVPTEIFAKRLFNTTTPWTMKDLDIQFNEDVDLIRRIAPDIVIGDTRASLYAACKQEKVVFYNLLNFHWNPLYNHPSLVPYSLPVKIFGRTLSTLLSGISLPLILHSHTVKMNRWLKTKGVNPIKNLFEFYSQGDHLLFPDLKENFPDSTVPANGHFIGPLIWKSEKVTWPSHWGKLDPQKKYAFVSMGSSGENDHIPKVVEALNQMGFCVLFVGPKSIFKDEKDYDMLIADFVPMDEALNHCSLAIGNGGTGTTYFFMEKGVTGYNIPTNLDQYLSVERLKMLGLSDYQHIDNFSKEKFISKVTDLMSSEDVQKKTAEKKKIIEATLRERPINQIL